MSFAHVSWLLLRYVGNLDRRATEDIVRETFTACGTIRRCNLISEVSLCVLLVFVSLAESSSIFLWLPIDASTHWFGYFLLLVLYDSIAPGHWSLLFCWVWKSRNCSWCPVEDERQEVVRKGRHDVIIRNTWFSLLIFLWSKVHVASLTTWYCLSFSLFLSSVYLF